MAGSIDKTKLVERYKEGASLPELAKEFGIGQSTARYHVRKAGALRSRAEATRLAGDKGKLGSGFRGKTRILSDSHKENISKGRKKWGDDNAIGTSRKPNGYIEFTRGPHKGRTVHVVKMEERLGRKLLPDEHVHHIDEDKQNNDINNLALVTRSGHMRLHRIMEAKLGKNRERGSNGQFS